MTRPRSRVLTAGTALLAAVALVLPATVPAFAADGPTIAVTTATPSPADGATNVSYTITIENAPPTCLALGHPFVISWTHDVNSAVHGDQHLSGTITGGQTVTGSTLTFTYLVGTVAGPATHFFFAETADPCLGGASMGSSEWISVSAPPVVGTTISGTVFEQQVGGSTDPADYARRAGVDINLWALDGADWEWVTATTTAVDGSYSLVAPIDDEYDENTQYLLVAEILWVWEYSYFYRAGSGPASPSPLDGDEATIFTANAATSYDIYAGRPAGVDATRTQYNCWSGGDVVREDVVAGPVDWIACLTDGAILDADMTYTEDAFDGFGYVVFPAIAGRQPDVDDLITDYFVTVEDADDVEFTETADGAVVRFRDEDVTVRNDAGDLVAVDVAVELVIEGQWARWTVDVVEAGTTTPATDVLFYLVGALGSGDDTVWLGDDEVSVSWGGVAAESPIIGHRVSAGSTWLRANGDRDVALGARAGLTYEVAIVDYCPDDVSLEDALAPVAAATFGDELELLGEACPALPAWPFTAPAFKVGEAFDQTFTAPTQDPWNWSQGGAIDVYDLPDGLDWEAVDEYEADTAPGVRIFGTPTTEGPYRFSIFLQDQHSHVIHFPVDGDVSPEGPYVFPGDDTIHGVVHVQQTRGEFTAGDYDVEEGLQVALVSLDYGTWWDADYTDDEGRFSLTAPVGTLDEALMRYVILVEVDDKWYYYENGAGFADPSTQDLLDATPIRPIYFDGDASYDVYAGRDLGVSDTVSDKICGWDDGIWEDVKTASVYWYYLCLTDGSIEYGEPTHADSVLSRFGHVVFPSRLDRVPDNYSYRQDYFVSADEYTVTDTATGVVLTLVDRGVEVFDETENLVDVDVEVTVEVSGQWTRWQVDVFHAGSRISADDVPFYFIGDVGSSDATTWEGAGVRGVSWDDGNGEALIGHRATGAEDWIYAAGVDEMSVLASGELTYELAVVDWCEGGVGDPMLDLLATLDGAAFGSEIARLGGVCDPQPEWEFPTPTFTVGVPFDETYTAPSDGVWDWTDGGVIDAFDLPDGLSVERLDLEVDGVAPSVRIHGTPTDVGFYRMYVELSDNAGHSWWSYVPGRVVAASGPGGGGDDGEDEGDPEELDLDIDLALGDLVAGGQVTLTATGLKDGAAFDLIVRSTPQTLAAGTVPTGGALTRTVTLPTLPAGWHSLTFTSTWSSGGPAVARVWFQVGADGTLLAVTRQAPSLANTGVDGTSNLLLGSLALFAGLGLVALRQRRTARV
jgi:hypothetical protein